MIRNCTLEDIPWMVSSAKETYGVMLDDEPGLYDYANYTIQDPDSIALRGESSVVMAHCVKLFYSKKKVIMVQPFWGHAREVVQILNTVKKWGKTMGAEDMEYRILTKIKGKKLAKMLGGEEIKEHYVVRL